MRKEYKRPSVVMVQIDGEPIMNITSTEQGSAGTGTGSAGDEDPEVAGIHRGNWGNLWK
jgi:hypothetical protein